MIHNAVDLAMYAMFHNPSDDTGNIERIGFGEDLLHGSIERLRRIVPLVRKVLHSRNTWL